MSNLELFVECPDAGVVKLVGTIPPGLSDKDMATIARSIAQVQRTKGVVGTSIGTLTATIFI